MLNTDEILRISEDDGTLSYYSVSPLTEKDQASLAAGICPPGKKLIDS